MFLEKITFISIVLFLIVFLSIKILKKYEPNNIFVIGLLSVALGSYIPFAIFNIFIPKAVQIILYIIGIVIPGVYILLQYNNIKLSQKLLYYNVKRSYKNKEYNKTIELIKRLIYLYGQKPEYTNMIAGCYKGLDDLITAKEYYMYTLTMDKYNHIAHYEIGNILEKFGESQEATEYYIKAIKIKHDYYEAYETLGILFTRKGKFKLAIDIYKNAINIFPTSFEMLYNLAMLQSELGYYDDAIESFEKVTNIKTDLYSAYYSLGKLYFNKGEYEKSIEAYKKVLNTTVYGTRAYYEIAVSYIKNGDKERAMSSLEYAMELDPHYVKEADEEYAFDSIREEINNYKIQKEKNKIKDYSNRNFKNKGFRLLNLDNKEENKEENKTINNDKQNEEKQIDENYTQIQNHA